ncbi:hypothetical protein FJ958_20420 [Mesorhizobium sp. B2-3-5]|nr:hypothetical protein FJ958_20420 [Mesorhizobium sp. B2-3-5]
MRGVGRAGIRHRAKVALKAGNGSRSFAQLPLQRILSQPKLNPKSAICDSPAPYRDGERGAVPMISPTAGVAASYFLPVLRGEMPGRAMRGGADIEDWHSAPLKCRSAEAFRRQRNPRYAAWPQAARAGFPVPSRQPRTAPTASTH